MGQTQKQIDLLHKFLSANGLKKTHQRDVIAKIFFSTPPHHYRIEELLEHSRQRDPSISYATVYRALMVFLDAGLAIQRQFGKGQSSFEQVTENHHDHLICIKCGSIVEFENNTIEDLQKTVAKKHGFILKYHKMELYGVCHRCRKQRSG